MRSILFVFLFLVSFAFAAQAAVLPYPSPGDSTETTPPSDWHTLDPESDKYPGVSVEKAYQLLQGKQSKTVLVAIIDSGIDIEHEDLKDVIWVNEDEVAGNGIDDDNNGYVDDIHGWSFLGSKEGNVDYETLELTRLYVKYKKQFEGKDEKSLKGKDKKTFKKYEKIKEHYEGELADYQEGLKNVKQIIFLYEASTFSMSEHFGTKDFTQEQVTNLETEDERLNAAKTFLMLCYENGWDLDILEPALEQYEERVQYNLNPEYDGRSIVGDDPNNVTDRSYGTSDVIGPDASHGTHVAGIVAAVRDNNLGVKGIANDVEIMVIRAVPSGDERDKDVANAIFYAVDNGAQIINMSFGKDYSPEKYIVDKAVKYAQKKGVLLIHAAGNDNKDIDKEHNFPTRSFKQSHHKKQAPNWIEVGASNWEEDLSADFSNYGKKSVDIFAPGVDIYSTYPEQKYENNDGTSMAAPVVTGVAALVLSYYPDLRPIELKEIILESAIPYKDRQVSLPGSEDQVRFGQLSVTGSIVNAYEAVKMAEERKK